MDDYCYTDVEVLKVVDGDTVDLRLTRDIGFYHYASVAVRFRLVEIDTPERGEVNRDAAKQFVVRWLALNRVGLTARTLKHAAPATTPDGGFGRWLVDLYSASGERLVDALVAEGLAVQYRRGN